MARILKVDELQGITAAGDITVTSEGGAATQSLQQGLVKQWSNFNGSGTLAVNDSFNTSSVTDNGTGDYSPQLTSSMGNSNYSLQCNGRQTSGLTNVRSLGGVTTKTTSQFRYGSVYVTTLGGGSTAFDDPEQNTSLQGDLA